MTNNTLFQHNKNYLTIIASGIVFSCIFYIRYMNLDHNLFQYRDDGVITMSIGRNLVDYGFFGVNPSGPIVEASSSPLETLLYAMIYMIFRIDYQNYSWAQTYFSAFLIGATIGAFFLEEHATAIFCSIISAVILSFIYPFFLWHASGMENALTHAMYLLTLYALYRMIKDGQINYYYALPVFLASITRVESGLHVAVLMLVFSIAWRRSQHNNSGFFFRYL